MDEKRLRRGWAREPGREDELADFVDAAFEYRGDITLGLTDGAEIVGYLFNRDRGPTGPFVELYDTRGRGPIRVGYEWIGTLRFTGPDMASGRTFEARQRRRKRGGGAQAGEDSTEQP